MKFYNIPVCVTEWTYSGNQQQRLGEIIVEHTLTGYREVLTKTPLFFRKDDMTIIQRKVLETYGFYFSILETHCVKRNFASEKDVSKYIQNIEQHPFHQFVNEHQYVYGKDEKEIKKMIKSYQKNK